MGVAMAGEASRRVHSMHRSAAALTSA